jgi:hypothetical protein
VAGNKLRRRRRVWPNVLLIGGGGGVLVVSFLLVLSLIRSYVEPPRIPAARPMLASADSTPVELTGLAEPNPSLLDLARATALGRLAAALARGESPQPAALAVEEPASAGSAVPLPPRRPRETVTRLSGDVPVPRPRPQD